MFISGDRAAINSALVMSMIIYNKAGCLVNQLNEDGKESPLETTLPIINSNLNGKFALFNADDSIIDETKFYEGNLRRGVGRSKLWR